ncbi:MAG TPA: hypothetical protein VNB06_03845 [Thermoanaerobaculia bacterium]|nr:hypothetical protein [Thermoanaerobaculia bacterium]
MKALGALLTDLGWIATEHLDHALKVQRAIGGRLGTCLLEIDALSEERLLCALCHQLGVPAARGADLRNIPPEVHQLVPSRLALRWQAVPFRMLGEDLHVAMLEVGNLEFQDELAFATGKRVRIHIANEARLYAALEEYFGFRHPQAERHHRLARRLDERIAAAGGPKASMSTDALPSSLPSPVAGSSAPTGDDWLSGLRSLDDPGQLAGMVIRRLEPDLRRVALFKIVKGETLGWVGAGAGMDQRRLAALRIGHHEPSVFLNLQQGTDRHLGPLAPMPAHDRIADCWGGGSPVTCLVQGIQIGPRLVGALFCDPGQDGFRPGQVARLLEVARELGVALGNCALRRRQSRSEARPLRNAVSTSLAGSSLLSDPPVRNAAAAAP